MKFSSKICNFWIFNERNSILLHLVKNNPIGFLELLVIFSIGNARFLCSETYRVGWIENRQRRNLLSYELKICEEF